MKRIIGLILVMSMLFSNVGTMFAAEDALNLQSQAIILIDEDSGKVLYEKNAHTKVYPASTVKILTALILEEYGDMNEITTIGNEVLQVPLDASKAGHVPGDQIKVKDLMAALFLPSGNDSAFAVAMYIIKKTTGAQELTAEEANAKFAILMNQKAKELGATESNFLNPHGYHDDNNYTTAYDMARITQAALKIPVIREIVAMSEYTIETEGQRAFDWVNRNLLLDPRNSEYYYQYATGVKTGYTEEAGECLVASATKDGLNLIAVLMNCPVDMRWGDAKALFDYGFDNFSLQTIVKKGDVVESVDVTQATRKGPLKLEGVAQTDVMQVLKNDEGSKVTKTVTWNQIPFVAPITAGQEVGRVTYTLDNQVLAEVVLTAKTAIEKQNAIEFVFSINAIPYWGAGIGALLVILLIVAIVKKKKSSRRGYHFR